MNSSNPARRVLEAGLATIRPLFDVRRFSVTVKDGQGHGRHAIATFRREKLEIGLIVRIAENRGYLGCPNYSEGAGYVGHGEVIAALGHAGEERLVKGEYLEFRDRSSGDPFDALRSDLEQIVFPELDSSSMQFSAALARALQQLREKRGW